MTVEQLKNYLIYKVGNVSYQPPNKIVSVYRGITLTFEIPENKNHDDWRPFDLSITLINGLEERWCVNSEDAIKRLLDDEYIGYTLFEKIKKSFSCNWVQGVDRNHGFVQCHDYIVAIYNNGSYVSCTITSATKQKQFICYSLKDYQTKTREFVNSLFYNDTDSIKDEINTCFGLNRKNDRKLLVDALEFYLPTLEETDRFTHIRAITLINKLKERL